MPSIALKYVDTSSVTYTRTFSTALSVKGFKPGDGHVQFPQLRNEYLNGSLRKKQAGFRRIIEIDFGVLTNANDLAFLGGFLGSENQYLTYTYDSTTETDLRVVDTHEAYEASWINNIEIGRQVIIRVEEANLITAFPSGTPTPATSDVSLYFTKKQVVTGTPSAPQTFTLGSGGSGTNITQDGAVAYPTVDTSVYRYYVEVQGLQGAKVFKTTPESVDGSDRVTFALAIDHMGSAFSDGAYYVDIILWLKLL